MRIDLEDGFPKEDHLPSITTLGRLFRFHHLGKKYEPNRPLPSGQIPKEIGAHDLWQIDDMGAELYCGVGYVGMLNAKDVGSRVQTACLLTNYEHSRQHPFSSTYLSMLRQAFTQFGMPKAIQADHGNLFYENTSKSPYPTPLHLWLLGLGINFCHSRIYRPTDQAVIERTHQTMHAQLYRQKPYSCLDELQQEAQLRMDKLNKRIPCSTLGLPPLIHNPAAQHSGRQFHASNEQVLYDKEKVANFLKNMEWYRLCSKVKTFSLGRHIYYHKRLPAQTQIRITFNPQSLTLFCYNDKELLAQIPIKGISYQELMAKF